MPLTLSKTSAKDIIVRLLTGRDHRAVVMALVDDVFLNRGIAYLREVGSAKMENKKIDADWYREHMLDDGLSKVDLATNAGTNVKTIKNAYLSERRSIVIEASLNHYQRIRALADELAALCASEEINFALNIRVGQVTVELSLSETVIVVNALAAKRANIAGGFWSTSGKRVEKPLMETLCRLFAVPEKHYRVKSKSTKKSASFEREIDFFLVSGDGEEKKCEVKMMGQGNPESADATIARDSDVFVADKLSNTNIKQLDSRGVLWVELNSPERFAQFAAMLGKLGIPRNETPNTNKTAIAMAVDAALADK